VRAKPELKTIEPFKTVLSGNRDAIVKLPTKDLLKILAATLSGMTVDEFKAEVAKWITTAKHPRWDRLYTELTYQPMLDVMQYLRANGYKTYNHWRRPGFCARLFGAGVWYPARAGSGHHGRHEVWL
jgi:hypothetical protein